MISNKTLWYGIMATVVLGWFFVFLGALFPFSGMRKLIWFSLIIIMAIGHPIELFISLPIGKKAGFSAEKTVFGTLIFGVTWWLPVKIGVFTENEVSQQLPCRGSNF